MLDCPPPPLRQPSTSEATPMKLLSASKESLDAASALSFPFTNAVDLLVKVTDRLELYDLLLYNLPIRFYGC
jgi:hypothetical protein